MTHEELLSPRLKLRVGDAAEALDERAVGGGWVGVRGGAGVVEGSKDAWRALLLDQVAYDLVVEVLDRRPLDLLAHVLLLLRLERELNKDLLELFVDIVDAELLERVRVEDLEAVDVEHANDVVRRRGRLHRLVDSVHDPLKQVVVDRLGQGIAHRRRLRLVQRHLVDRSCGGCCVSGATRVHIPLRTSSTATLRLHYALGQGLVDCALVDLEQVRDKGRDAVVRDGCVPLAVLGELDVADPEDRGEHAQDLVLLGRREPDDVHGVDGLAPVCDVVDAGHVEALALACVGVRVGPLQAVRLALLRRGAFGQLVEDVKVALVLDLANDSVLSRARVSECPKMSPRESRRTFSRR